MKPHAAHHRLNRPGCGRATTFSRPFAAGLLAAAAVLTLASCQREKPDAAEPAAAAPPAAEAAAQPAAQPAAPAAATAAAPAAAPAGAAPRVKLVTNKGDIVLELNPGKAPLTVANFLGYVERKHYDGTIFHRVIDGFMIQGGGFALKDGLPTEKPTGPGIRNEGGNGLLNNRGTVAMARTSDPDSASAQFFINVNDNAGLNRPNPDGHGYAVFGKVVEGMDVVDAIKGVATGDRPLAMLHPVTGQPMQQTSPDVPLQPVVITSAVLLAK